MRIRFPRSAVATLAVAVGLVGLAPAGPAAAAGHTISGVVTLPGGPEPAALDAMTVAYAPEGSSSYRTVDVTATGAFSITDLAPGRYHVCARTASYFSDAGDLAPPYNVLNACFATPDYFGPRGTLDVTGGSLTGLTLALPWGRTISGTVRLASGADPEWLRGVRAFAYLSVPGGFLGNQVDVDPVTGRYVIDALYPGEYPVEFRISDYTDPATGARVTPGISPGSVPGTVDVRTADAAGADVTLDAPGVTGRFTAVPVPELTGAPVVGGTLTAVTGTWTPAATSYAYRWYRDGTQIPGATGRTYEVQPADLDHGIQVTVRGSASGIASSETTSTWVTIRATFTTVGTPGVTGGRTVGSTLTCAPGTWAPTPTVLGYEWRRGAATIGTGATYRVQASDEGRQLRCHVFASRGDLPQVTAVSAPVSVPRSFGAAGSVTVAGSTRLGSTLTASVVGTTPVPDEVEYRWFRDGTAIPGAVGASHVVTLDDSLATLGVRAVVSRAGYLDATTPLAQVAVPGLFAATPAPRVTGSPRPGATLTASVPAWTPAASLAYQWLRDGAAIAGATSSDYTLTSADEGTSVAVRVTGSRAQFLPQAVTSVGVDVLRTFAASPAPTVTGSTAPGGTLTVSAGAWSPSPEAVTYQWLRDGTAIAKAVAPDYAVAESDGGRTIAVRVTAARAGYVTTTVVSAPVVVPLREFISTPTPTVTGTPRAGHRLTARRGTWVATPSTVTYRWSRDGRAISGATASTYLLTTADQGRKITVTVTGARAGYRTVAQSSAATAVLREFTAAPVPKVVGSAKAGRTLTARRGAWTPAPTTTTFRWYRNGVAIAGATTATYTLRPADRGRTITVRVTGTRSGYATLTRASAGVTVAR